MYRTRPLFSRYNGRREINAPLSKRFSSNWYCRILAYTRTYTRARCSSLRFGEPYLYVYNIHSMSMRATEDRVFLQRGFELKPIDRRRDTNPREGGTPPIIYEPRHLSRRKPRDGDRIPTAFAFARFLRAGETTKSDLSDYPENFGIPSEYLDAPYPINRNVITLSYLGVQGEIWVVILL